MNIDADKDSSVQGERLISLVLPVFNEEDNLLELHRTLTEVLSNASDDYELIFVDDGSSDGSFNVLQQLQASDRKVRVIRFRRNFGKAAAYSAGFRHARGEILITLDTDLQDDPSEIPTFIEEIDRGYDLVVGWKHRGKGSFDKTVPSKIFNRIVSLVTKIPLHDFNCPFKAYRREVFQEIEVYGELHRYIPVLASAKGFSLTEIKIKNRPRRHGKSKYGRERYIRGVFDLMTVVFITRFSRRPLHFLGAGGMVISTVGATIMLFFIIAHIMYRLEIVSDRTWNIHDRPAISLAILLIMVGVQFFSIGLLGELFITKRESREDSGGYSIKQILEN